MVIFIDWYAGIFSTGLFQCTNNFSTSDISAWRTRPWLCPPLFQVVVSSFVIFAFIDFWAANYPKSMSFLMASGPAETICSTISLLQRPPPAFNVSSTWSSAVFISDIWHDAEISPWAYLLWPSSSSFEIRATEPPAAEGHKTCRQVRCQWWESRFRFCSYKFIQKICLNYTNAWAWQAEFYFCVTYASKKGIWTQIKFLIRCWANKLICVDSS